MNKFIVLDLETTGVKYSDEILQVSIIDDKKQTLFSEYIKPDKHTTWEEAQKVNKITPETVKNCNNLLFYKDKLLQILQNTESIVGYNIKFDIKFLERALNWKCNIPLYDVMLEFAKLTLYKRDDIGFRFKLTQVCDALDIDLSNAHDALADTIGTYDCYVKMQELFKKPKLNTIYKFPDGKEIYSEHLAKAYANKCGSQWVSTYYLVDGKRQDTIDDISKYNSASFIKPGAVN